MIFSFDIWFKAINIVICIALECSKVIWIRFRRSVGLEGNLHDKAIDMVELNLPRRPRQDKKGLKGKVCVTNMYSYKIKRTDHFVAKHFVLYIFVES